MEIFSGTQIKALKVVVYGPEGIGKSTLASKFSDPLFIDTEDSTKFMDVKRFKKPAVWQELNDQVKYVLSSPGLCKTLVLDTADWAEKLCIKSICEKYQKSGIEAFDYGKGYTYVYESFGELLNLLGDITERGIDVVITAHAATRRREQVDEFGTYDCWGLKLIDSPKCSISRMIMEWADTVLFANYKTYVVAADNSGKKHKAQGGKRVLYTAHHPCWDAKNRQGMPEELPMDFEALRPYLFPNGVKAMIGAERATAKAESRSVPSAAAADHVPESVPDHITESSAPAIKDDTFFGEAPDVLRQLMERDLVTDFEVREVIAKKQRSFPMETSWAVMEKTGFVNGWVIPHWGNIVNMIRENPNRLPF